MSNNYNANIYLTTKDLNDIEDRIENITEECQEQIFDNDSNNLRNIQVGDDLGGKTLYLSFPRTTNELIPDTDTNNHYIINIGNDYSICYKCYSSGPKIVGVRYKNRTSDTGYLIQFLYAHNINAINPYLNFVRFKLPKNCGKVTSIDTDNPFYQYIKIYDESMIPDYTKHIWTDNEVLTMQKIDNIEQGIKNIGFYYDKPNGWVNEKEWLGKNAIKSATNYGVGVKTISYQDLNRWYNNLDLINFDDLSNMTIWNAIDDISQIEWNNESNEEWVDNFIINVYELNTEDNNILITENNDNLAIITTQRL